MQNPLHFPYTFPVPNFANMIDCDFHHASTAAHNHNASLAISALQNSARNDSSSEVHRSSNGPTNCNNKSPSPQHHHLDPIALATSRLLFPPFLTHSLCGFPPSDDTISAAKDKLKRSGISSKSFMIDHLLGLNRLSAASHHHLAHHHQQLPLAGIGGLGANLQNWKKSADSVKEGQSRFHPYHGNNSGNLTSSNGISSNGGSSNNLGGNNQSHNENSNAKSKSTSQKSSNSGSAQPTEKSQESHQSSRRAAKAKRVRTIFTPEQLERLEAEFERQQYMVGPERLYLASSLNLTEAQVKVWFQNRRIKWRKQHLEIQQQRLAAFRSQHEEGDEENSSDFGSASSPTPTDVSSSCVNDLATASSQQVSPSANFSAHGSLVGNQLREALSSLQGTSHHGNGENESRSSAGSPPFSDAKFHSRSRTSSEDY